MDKLMAISNMPSKIKFQKIWEKMIMKYLVRWRRRNRLWKQFILGSLRKKTCITFIKWQNIILNNRVFHFLRMIYHQIWTSTKTKNQTKVKLSKNENSKITTKGLELCHQRGNLLQNKIHQSLLTKTKSS